MSGSAKDGTKRWAIAPPPPHVPTSQSISGEFSLALEAERLLPTSWKHDVRRPAPSTSAHRTVVGTLPPDGVEPSDSDRPTETPCPPGRSGLEVGREFPTIPAPEWSEVEAVLRPPPAVPTQRGFFLESLAEADQGDEQTHPSESRALSDEALLRAEIDFDVDDTL